MSAGKSDRDATASPKAHNLTVHLKDGTRVEDDALIDLHRADVLHFSLELASKPETDRFLVTVVIHKHGKSSPVNSGEVRNARFATAVTQPVTVEGGPSGPWFLEFDVHDDTPPRFHDGSGPYETTIALTPTDGSGRALSSGTSSVSYDFVGIE